MSLANKLQSTKELSKAPTQEQESASDLFSRLSSTKPQKLVNFVNQADQTEIPIIIRLSSASEDTGIVLRASKKSNQKLIDNKDIDKETADDIKAKYLIAEKLYMCIRNPDHQLDNGEYLPFFNSSEEILNLNTQHIQQFLNLLEYVQAYFLEDKKQIDQIINNFDDWVKRIATLPEEERFLALCSLGSWNAVEILANLVPLYFQISQQIILGNTGDVPQQILAGDTGCSTEEPSNTIESNSKLQKRNRKKQANKMISPEQLKISELENEALQQAIKNYNL